MMRRETMSEGTVRKAMVALCVAAVCALAMAGCASEPAQQADGSQQDSAVQEQVPTQDQAASQGQASSAADGAAGGFVGEDKAAEIALKDAGVSSSEAEYLTAYLDRDDGRDEYEVEFYVGRVEYSYDIDAKTGSIISKDIDRD